LIARVQQDDFALDMRFAIDDQRMSSPDLPNRRDPWASPSISVPTDGSSSPISESPVSLF
jgi:hypothetical protein